MLGNQYPFNLIRAIYRDDKDDHTHTETTYLKGLREQIDKLPPNEKRGILLRYKQELSLRGCGEHLGVSVERARQIIEKALSRLRHPSRLRQYEVVPKSEYQKLEEKCEQLSSEVKILNESLQAVANHDVDPYALVMMTLMVKPEHLIIPISELALSTRAYNALNRSGIKTIGDVLELSDDELRSKRNLGGASFDEIKAKIKARLLLPEHYQEDGGVVHESNTL